MGRLYALVAALVGAAIAWIVIQYFEGNSIMYVSAGDHHWPALCYKWVGAGLFGVAVWIAALNILWRKR